MIFSKLLAGALPALPTDVVNPLEDGGPQSIDEFFAVGINLIAGVGFAYSLVTLSLGVVDLVLSQGDKYKIQSGQKRITYSIVAMAISFGVIALRTLIPLLLTGEEFDITGVTPDGS